MQPDGPSLLRIPMQTATLKETVMRPDGGVFRKGSRFLLLRRFWVNRQTEECFALGYADGRVILPWVDPEIVTLSGESETGPSSLAEQTLQEEGQRSVPPQSTDCAQSPTGEPKTSCDGQHPSAVSAVPFPTFSLPFSSLTPRNIS